MPSGFDFEDIPWKRLLRADYKDCFMVVSDIFQVVSGIFSALSYLFKASAVRAANLKHHLEIWLPGVK